LNKVEQTSRDKNLEWSEKRDTTLQWNAVSERDKRDAKAAQPAYTYTRPKYSIRPHCVAAVSQAFTRLTQ